MTLAKVKRPIARPIFFRRDILRRPRRLLFSLISPISTFLSVNNLHEAKRAYSSREFRKSYCSHSFSLRAPKLPWSGLIFRDDFAFLKAPSIFVLCRYAMIIVFTIRSFVFIKNSCIAVSLNFLGFHK